MIRPQVDPKGVLVALLSSLKAFLSTPVFNNIRAVLYVAAPAALFQLVDAGKLSQDHANLVLAVAVAFLSPALASIFAPAGLRTWLYGLLAPAQGILVWVGGANNLWVAMIVAVLTSVVTSGLAAANVHNASNVVAESDAASGT